MVNIPYKRTTTTDNITIKTKTTIEKMSNFGE